MSPIVTTTGSQADYDALIAELATGVRNGRTVQDRCEQRDERGLTVNVSYADGGPGEAVTFSSGVNSHPA